MSTLTRYAGQLAMIAGVIWIVSILVQIAVPTAPTWIALFASILLIGGAALGLRGRFGARIGQLGRGAALATAVGSIALIAVVLFVLAAGLAHTNSPPPPIIIAASLLSFLVWLIASLVFAVSLMRAKAIEPIAGWLIVVGALVGVVVLLAGGQKPPPVIWLPLVAYGAGWVLLGYAARSPATEPTLASQPS